jgi:hypothetical protein
MASVAAAHLQFRKLLVEREAGGFLSRRESSLRLQALADKRLLR